MKQLSNQELSNINGGFKWNVFGLIIGGLISFVAGIVDGFNRPQKCNI